MGAETRFTQARMVEANAEYIIYKDGNVTKAKNCSTGAIEIANTDPTSVIQYALDAVTSGMVFLKSGKYTITDTLTISNQGTEFCGNLWRGSDAPGDYGIHLDNNVDKDMLQLDGLKCHVHDLFLYGNKANNAAGSCIKTVNDGSLDLHLTDVYLLYPKEHGLELYGGAGHFSGVYAEYCDGVGFQLNTTATRNAFFNCGAYSCLWGFEVKDKDNRFIGCISADSIEYGWLLETQYAVKNVLDACTIQNTTKEALWIYGGKENIISNCIFDNAGDGTDDTYAAVKLSDYPGEIHSTYNVISNNIIRSDADNKPKYGIEETDSNQDYNMISNNNIENCITAAILPNGVNSTIKDNIGWKNENCGSISGIFCSGFITHGLGTIHSGNIIHSGLIPTCIQITPATPVADSCGISALNASVIQDSVNHSGFNVSLTTCSGCVPASGLIYWEAKYNV